MCQSCYYYRVVDGEEDCAIGHRMGNNILCITKKTFCLYCHRSMPAGKRFCSKYCKNSFHNERRHGYFSIWWRDDPDIKSMSYCDKNSPQYIYEYMKQKEWAKLMLKQKEGVSV